MKNQIKVTNQRNPALLFTAAILLLGSLSATAAELSVNDLRSRDSTFDQQLEEAGFVGGADELEGMTAVFTEDESAETFSVEVTKKKDPILPGRHGFSPNQPKNFIAFGLVASNIFPIGLRASYLHFQPRKDRFNYQINASYSVGPNMSNLTLSFDKYIIGKSGLLVGVNGQAIRVKSDLLPTSPATTIPGVGFEIGWQKAFGNNKQFYAGVLGDVYLTNYEFQNYILPSGKVTLGYIIPHGQGLRKTKHIKRLSNSPFY